jgi:hypothetical protein
LIVQEYSNRGFVDAAVLPNLDRVGQPHLVVPWACAAQDLATQSLARAGWCAEEGIPTRGRLHLQGRVGGLGIGRVSKVTISAVSNGWVVETYSSELKKLVFMSRSNPGTACLFLTPECLLAAWAWASERRL